MIARIQKRLQEKAEGTEKGFTLVELLVVIIIIGILAAIAIPLYLNQQAKAQDSSAKADANTFRTAVIAALTEDPAATITWSAQSGPASVDLSDGTSTVGTAPISDGNSVAAAVSGGIDSSTTGTTTIVEVTSATGAKFAIDANGLITETPAP